MGISVQQHRSTSTVSTLDQNGVVILNTLATPTSQQFSNLSTLPFVELQTFLKLPAEFQRTIIEARMLIKYVQENPELLPALQSSDSDILLNQIAAHFGVVSGQLKEAFDLVRQMGSYISSRMEEVAEAISAAPQRMISGPNPEELKLLPSGT